VSSGVIAQGPLCQIIEFSGLRVSLELAVPEIGVKFSEPELSPEELAILRG